MMKIRLEQINFVGPFTSIITAYDKRQAFLHIKLYPTTRMTSTGQVPEEEVWPPALWLYPACRQLFEKPPFRQRID